MKRLSINNTTAKDVVNSFNGIGLGKIVLLLQDIILMNLLENGEYQFQQ